MSFRTWFENMKSTSGRDSLRQPRRQNLLRKRGSSAWFQAAEVLLLEERTLLSAPTLVHSLGAVAQIQTGRTSLDLTTTAAVGAGHSVILELAMLPAAGAVSAFAHAPGSTAHLLDFHVDADVTTALTGKGAVRTVLFSSHGTPALSAGSMITITFPGSNAQAASAAEFRGLSAANTLDVTVAANGKAAAVSSGTSKTTAAPRELLIGAIGVLGKPDAAGANDATHNLGFTAGTGYNVWAGAGTTTGKTGKNISLHPEFELVSSIGTYQANGTLSKAAIGKSRTLLAGYRADVADHFSISAPASVVSGQSFAVTVTARDAAGNVDGGYSGTVHWTSSDGAAGIGLPADVTFTVADRGVRQFTLTLLSDGSRSVTVTDKENVPLINGSATLQVHPAGFSVTVPSGATAGQPFAVTVRARRFDGGIDTSYTGTVHFTRSDTRTGSAVPTNYTFVAGDAGVHTFDNSVTLVTVGNQSVTATDTGNASVTGSGAVTVAAGVATQFAVSAPATATVGKAISVTVTARDQYGNVATGYRGSIHFTSIDVAGSGSAVPADYAFSAGDVGVHTFSNAVTFMSAGNQSVTATDTSNPSVTGSGAVSVTPAAATHFAVMAPATAAVGSAFSITVTALDEFNALATSYTGTIHFTMSELAGSGATVPADYTFVAGDGGVHTFSDAVTFATVGNQSVTATDTSNASVTGSSAPVSVVSPVAATHFAVTTPVAATAGTAFSVTVTARDDLNIVAVGYLGTVHFKGSDAHSSVPSDYTFTAEDKGSHTFKNLVIFETAGQQSVTATDTIDTSVTGSSKTLSVIPAAVARFTVTTPANAVAGSAFSFTVTAQDRFKNVVAGYTGTVHFASTDGSALLPTDYTFGAGDAGVHMFVDAATLVTGGVQSLSATDTIQPSLTGSGSVSVSSAVTRFAISGIPAVASLGTPFSVTVTALDQFGKVVAGYAGTVHFACSDKNAVLPADYTFIAGDDGVHTFADSIVLATFDNGSSTLRISDFAIGITASITLPVAV